VGDGVAQGEDVWVQFVSAEQSCGGGGRQRRGIPGVSVHRAPPSLIEIVDSEQQTSPSACCCIMRTALVPVL